MGKISHRAKLTAEEVKAIRKSSKPQRELAAKYGVCTATIHMVKSRKTYRSVA